MENHQVVRKPTINGKVAPGVPVKPRTIAKIRDFFRKWQDSPLKDRPAICRSISETDLPFVRTVYYNDNDDDNSTSDDECDDNFSFIFPDIPPGHFGVLVGVSDQEVTRFVMPIKFLWLPPFEVMLRKSYEVYGLIKDGPIRLLVEPNTFRYILQCSLAQYKDVPLPYSDSDSSSDDESSLRLGNKYDPKKSR